MCSDCPKRAINGTRYCEDHQEHNQEIDNSRLRDWNRRENDPFHALYSQARWFATRLRVLWRDPLCKVCGCHASTVVDHIVPARKWVAQHNGDLESFYDESNLQGLCRRDHDLKTRRGE
jgi:5-methylcytosine-specific restriction endonuclease McrA